MSTLPPLPIVRSPAELRTAVAAWRSQGHRIGFVPTMGALHAGHLALVRQAGDAADRVVASLFVNPRQFAPAEDLNRYPRRESADAELLAGAGCGLLYAPTPEIVYPAAFATRVLVGGPSAGLETDFRPHFFEGVATVVTKLLIQVQADVAVFGEKDYQQLLVVRRLAADLDLATEILSGPTVREPDGLALSSRNAYLSAAERAIAAQLNRVLRAAAAQARDGDSACAVEGEARAALMAAGFREVDYVAIRRADDLRPFADGVDAPARVLAAAWLGDTRLIDNLAV